VKIDQQLTVSQLKANHKALLEDIQSSERKRARLDTSIKRRKQRLNRLESQIALIGNSDIALPVMSDSY